MKSFSPFAFLLIGFISASNIHGQDVAPEKAGRPRSVSAVSQTPTQPVTAPPKQGPISPPLAAPRTSLGVNPDPKTAAPLTPLTPVTVLARISEAERLLKSKPKTTAMTTPSIEFVTIAALDQVSGKTHLITLAKETFLTRNAELTVPSSQGTLVTVRVIRANGVNTALSMITAEGASLVPLLVEFPIEKGGLFREMAYYTSAHPALLSNDLTRAGQSYVRNMLDLATKRLKDKGVTISPNLVDIAERLCVVEHTDHDRFRQENRLALFSEIYSLYALNELETYRYSVSVAGAGGMVQMIPWAYNLERQRHPGVALIPDFVNGMRNHANALQAMLLYMQDTWSELTANEDIQYAMNSKIATMPELMAAGYNSNAAKLPLYIRKGGDAWRTLIPKETQMYLQIYKSFESLVPLKPRADRSTIAGN